MRSSRNGCNHKRRKTQSQNEEIKMKEMKEMKKK